VDHSPLVTSTWSQVSLRSSPGRKPRVIASLLDRDTVVAHDRDERVAQLAGCPVLADACRLPLQSSRFGPRDLSLKPVAEDVQVTF
jgi:hypothetical protein